MQQQLAYPRMSETAHVLLSLYKINGDAWFKEIPAFNYDNLSSSLEAWSIALDSSASYLRTDRVRLDPGIALPSWDDVRLVYYHCYHWV